MKVGTVVLLTKPILGNPIHTVGFCYETYTNGGASFIFENGEYDGFSEEDQNIFLHVIEFSYYLSDYHFINVSNLCEDYYCGIFSSILEPSDEMRNHFIQKMRSDKIYSLF